MAILNPTDPPQPPPSFYQRNSRLVNTAAIAGSIATILFGFLLWHGNVFWTASVSQLHGACSAAGPFVSLAGTKALSACSDADTAYPLLLVALVISVLVAVAGFAVLIFDDVHRGSRKD